MRKALLTGGIRIFLGALLLAACDDSTEPVKIPLPDEPREVLLSDILVGDLLLPSAFDLISRNAVRTDQAAGWDFVYFDDPDLGPVVQPRSVLVPDDGDGAGIQLVDTSFTELTEAPADGYTTDTPVQIAVNDVFVTRSRTDPAFGSLRCRYFGKFVVDAIDEVNESLTVRHIVNPNCEDRNLDPDTNP